MSMKVAKLVTAELTVRVVVEDSDNDQQIIDASQKAFMSLINSGELYDNVTEIENDEVCPYGSYPDEEV